jgi:hypothetical protein
MLTIDKIICLEKVFILIKINLFKLKNLRNNLKIDQSLKVSVEVHFLWKLRRYLNQTNNNFMVKINW